MSDLNTFNSDQPPHWQLRTQMAGDTLRQIEKDFALHGISLLLNINDVEYSNIVKQLAGQLHKISFLDNPKFGAILYQIDLNESDLAMAIHRVSPAVTYLFLADKIIKRCFEKVYWRYKNANG